METQRKSPQVLIPQVQRKSPQVLILQGPHPAGTPKRFESLIGADRRCEAWVQLLGSTSNLLKQMYWAEPRWVLLATQI